jgi:hypothetical protein
MKVTNRFKNSHFLNVIFRLFGNRCEFIQRHGTDMLESLTWSELNRNIPVRTAPGFDPIDNDMEHEDQRLRSFQRNNGWRGEVEPWKLAAAGFYYTGIHDHVKCFACDVSLKAWLPGDNPIQEHLKIEPNCSYISRFGNKFSISYAPNVSLQETGSTQPNFGQTLRSTSYDPSMVHQPPVSTPVNRAPVAKPNYASEHARLHTFINWPKDCPVQPKELIDAGFYYTRNGDRVECFKCGIILAGWEPLDTPWGEHEKWSKDCSLVVEHLRRRNPRSPSQGPRAPGFPQEQTWTSPPKVLYPPPPGEGPSEMEEETKGEEGMKGEEGTKGCVVRLPPEEGECSKMAEQNKRAEEGSTEDEIFYLQKAAQKLVEDGRYNYATINEAVQQKTKIEGGSIESMADLLDAIQSYQMSNRKSTTATGNNPVVANNPTGQTSGFSLVLDPEALHRQVQKLEDAHRCKICLDADIGIVFLPCGHLVCCPKCARELQAKGDAVCPICRKQIKSTIRSYLT